MYTHTIRVTQLIQDLSDPDDRDELPAGPDGKGSYKDYDITAPSKEAALDEFHHTIPIGCLDDFHIRVV